jgi:hypothetical protein
MESGPALILRCLDRHLTGPGMVRLFGGAALILCYGRARQTEDADLLLDDAECRALIDGASFGEALEAANAELNPQGLYLTHIFGPEQEILAPGWRERCRRVAIPGLRRLDVWSLGPLDLALTKLGRGDEGDLDDLRFLLETNQLSADELRAGMEQALVPDELREVFAGARVRVLALLDEGARQQRGP